MSTAPRSPAEIEVEKAEDAWRTDGSVRVDQRTAFHILFNDPGVRSYTFAALGALAMTFLILFQQGSDLGGLFVVVFGISGVMFRWTAAPALILIVITYFMWTPFGVPGGGYPNSLEIEDKRFDPVNVIFVLSVVVYLACQFRIYGLVSQAVTDESPRRKDDPTTRRPPSLIRPSELGVLFAIAAGLVVIGHVVWWFVNVVEVAPAEEFPLRWAERYRGLGGYTPPPGGMPPGVTRFVVLVGILFFGFLLSRLVFGYWRLRVMGPAEARMILLDGGWSETSRERSRLEKWRVWGRTRAAAQEEKEQTRTGDKP